MSLTQKFDKVVEPMYCADQNSNMSHSSISFIFFPLLFHEAWNIETFLLPFSASTTSNNPQTHQLQFSNIQPTAIASTTVQITKNQTHPP